MRDARWIAAVACVVGIAACSSKEDGAASPGGDDAGGGADTGACALGCSGFGITALSAREWRGLASAVGRSPECPARTMTIPSFAGG